MSHPVTAQKAYWRASPAALFDQLGSRGARLSTAEAAERLGALRAE